MGRGKSRTKPRVIDPDKFGVSFSLKQCANFKIDQKKCLEFLLELGFRRFRLMSYWNEHEKIRGTYDFSKLDQQFELIEKQGGIVTFCLGVRQPRWPENHWPSWSLQLSKEERDKALITFIEAVVERYKNHGCLISYQLENEFLNRSFGEYGDFDRRRVRTERSLVKQIDPDRPLIMSTSNTYGIPLRRPTPDQFGFTLYQTQFKDGAYSRNKIPVSWWLIRAKIIKFITGRTSFIHELQAEPWGPKAIWEMSQSEQEKSMNSAQLKTNIQLAKSTNLYPIDLWGGEWWYWRSLRGDNFTLEVLKKWLFEQIGT